MNRIEKINFHQLTDLARVAAMLKLSYPGIWEEVEGKTPKGEIEQDLSKIPEIIAGMLSMVNRDTYDPLIMAVIVRIYATDRLIPGMPNRSLPNGLIKTIHESIEGVYVTLRRRIDEGIMKYRKNEEFRNSVEQAIVYLRRENIIK
jgi:hypothetical protein